jgi:hypothetical protein
MRHCSRRVNIWSVQFDDDDVIGNSRVCEKESEEEPDAAAASDYYWECPRRTYVLGVAIARAICRSICCSHVYRGDCRLIISFKMVRAVGC